LRKAATFVHSLDSLVPPMATLGVHSPLTLGMGVGTKQR